MSKKREPKRVEIGGRLTAAREALGLSQVAICREIDVSPSRWNQWEMGGKLPDPLVMAEFSRRYGITMDWIYAGNASGLPHSLVGKVLASSSAQADAKDKPGAKLGTG
ncbi:MAG: putative DNA binding helix-turn helix protein [Rhodospirillaceae bacterium]|nr:MAG: putative DNA binding helix-turn helix protein [Rhodospirillaceae bacterium]